MTQYHTINVLIKRIMEKNRKIGNSPCKIKIPMCIYDNCHAIRIVMDNQDVWTSNYQKGLLVNQTYIYREITGSVCPEHLKQAYRKHGV